MKTLHLTLIRKWFEMTKSGEKKEEYREITHYWIKRLMSEKYNKIYPTEQDAIDGIIKHVDKNYLVKNHHKRFNTTRLTLGYPKRDDLSRIIELQNLGVSIGEGREEWGAEKGKLYFVIKHGEKIA